MNLFGWLIIAILVLEETGQIEPSSTGTYFGLWLGWLLLLAGELILKYIVKDD